MLRNKSKVAIALLLTLSFAISMFAVLPNANGAVTAVPDRATGAYISTNPDVIGINQELTVNLWVYPSPDGPHGEMGLAQTGLTGALVGIHFTDLTVTFTRPDGSKDTFMPAFGSTALGFPDGVTDEVGGLWFSFKPNQIGKWSVSFSFPGNTFTAQNYSVSYKTSTSQIITFTVQQDNVQIGFPPVQLPTGYWERPINPENREWSTISGNWV